MKKVLLFLMLFTTVLIKAQEVNLEATFDFNNPTTLNPSITPVQQSNSGIPVFNKVFKSGSINLSFSKLENDIGGSVELKTYVNTLTDQFVYRLNVSSHIVVNITCEENSGAVLDSLRISNSSVLGDLGLIHGQPGQQIGKYWKSNSKSVTSVSYYVTVSPSVMDKLTVYYSAPSETLVPSSTNLDGKPMESFSSLALTFNKSGMSVEDASGIKLTGPQGERSVTASASGSTVTLSVNPAITEEGQYTITIPARSFKSSEGYENKELQYTFTVQAPRNTFDFTSSDPEQNTPIVKVPNGFILTFPERVGGVVNPSSTLEILDSNGQRVRSLKAERLGNTEPDNYSVKFTFKNGDGDITTSGTYTFILPEGVVYNNYFDEEASDHGVAAGATFNPQRTLAFIVDETLDPTKPHDSQTMKDAKELLKKTGIGYPSANSASRQTLVRLTTAEEVPTDEELENAMQAFYSETDVTMPEVGKWYAICGVNKSGRKLYLAYKEGVVKLDLGRGDAALKLSGIENGKYVFETVDGKFLHVLKAAGDTHVGTSESNVTDNNTFLNKLSLSRLLVDGVAAKETMGLLTINGSLGSDAGTGVPQNAYALINFSTDIIVTSADDQVLHFDEELSNAFSFAETTEPVLITGIDPEIIINPFTVESNTASLTLVFQNISKVTLSDLSKVYFSNSAEGTEHINGTAANILTAISGKQNEFTVHADGLANGLYYLVMPEGTFSYTGNSEEVNDKRLVAVFKIEGNGGGGDQPDDPTPPTPSTDFDESYESYSFNLLDCIGRPNVDYIADTDLNNFVIYTFIPEYYSDLVCDPSKTVTIVRALSGSPVRSGHFEPYPTFAKDYPIYEGRKAIRLVLDQPFHAGDLKYKSGLYAIQIPAATFGDANFGKWLANPNSVSPSMCKVNKKSSSHSFQLNNSLAEPTVSIENIDADAIYGEQRVYDLNGRRVAEPVKGGIYIINGRKVLVK